MATISIKSITLKNNKVLDNTTGTSRGFLNAANHRPILKPLSGGYRDREGVDLIANKLFGTTNLRL